MKYEFKKLQNLGAKGLKEIASQLAKNLTIKSAQSSEGVKDVIHPTDLMFASTGVIGEKFPTSKIKNRIGYIKLSPII